MESPTKTGPWILLGALIAFTALVLWVLYHFVLGPGLMSNVVRRRQATAQTQILELQRELEGWSARNTGRYPVALVELLRPDAHGQPGLGGALELPKDPWSHEYTYAPPRPGQLRPDVRSLGRDGLPGGAGEDADIDREGLVPLGR